MCGGTSSRPISMLTTLQSSHSASDQHHQTHTKMTATDGRLFVRLAVKTQRQFNAQTQNVLSRPDK